jgi:uncharacterized membrane protein YidH (DUF202 family)
MSIIHIVIGGGIILAAYAAYQLYQSKRAITFASDMEKAKADVAVVKEAAAVVKSDVSKL